MLDLLIVGAGPAGLSAAVYAKRAAFEMCVLEKERHGFGQITLSDRVDNYLGISGVDGYALGESFKKHAESLNVPFKYSEAVSMEKKDEVFLTTLQDGKILESRCVIYAAGAVRKQLGVEGEEHFAGGGVSYCAACDGAFYHNKVVAVIGGGDTALGDSIFLSKLCSKVYLIHRRAEFRGAAAMLNRIKRTDNIEIIAPASVTRISGGSHVESLTLNNGKIIDVDGVFVAVGTIPNTALIRNLVSCDCGGYIIANEDGKTNIDGFFAAGDVRTKRLRQIITAAADGANAVSSAEEFLRNR